MLKVRLFPTLLTFSLIYLNINIPVHAQNIAPLAAVAASSENSGDDSLMAGPVTIPGNGQQTVKPSEPGFVWTGTALIWWIG
jgi:hypothetical protein